MVSHRLTSTFLRFRRSAQAESRPLRVRVLAWRANKLEDLRRRKGSISHKRATWARHRDGDPPGTKTRSARRSTPTFPKAVRQ